jgi:hypothetical protein
VNSGSICSHAEPGLVGVGVADPDAVGLVGRRHPSLEHARPVDVAHPCGFVEGGRCEEVEVRVEAASGWHDEGEVVAGQLLHLR